MIEYYEGDELLAKAFRYRLPSGETGASGLPDPQWVCIEGEILTADKRPGHPCDRCGGPCTAAAVT